MSNILEKIEMAKKLSGWDEMEVRNKAYDMYTNPDKKISKHSHGYYVGKSVRLFDKIVDANGPMEDLITAAKYMLLCIDCQKHQLDVKKFEVKNKIVLLLHNYGFPVKIVRVSKEP